MTDICNLCGKAAILMCQRCNETYCSTNCQILDWRVHKKVCFQMPTLIPIKEFVSKNSSFVSNRLNESDSPRNRTPTENRNVKRPLNRNPLKIPSDDALAFAPPENPSPNTKALPEIDFSLKPKLVVKQTDLKSNVSQCSKVSTRTGAWQTPFSYPEGVFFDVIVQYAEEGTNSDIVWVTELKYEGALRKLLAEINRNIDVNTDRCSNEEIQIGALIAAPFENLYYRAEIIEIIQISQMAVVHLIDYGNMIETAFKDLRSPIPIMRNLNAYAFRIHYPKPVVLETVLSICVIKKESNGVAKVEEKKSMTTMPVLLTAESFSTDPTADVVKLSGSGKYALLRLTNQLVTDQLKEMDKFMNTDASSQLSLKNAPKDGDYVVAKTLHGWSRAVVMSIYRNDYLVYLIDEGRITLVELVMSVPENIKSLPLQVFAVELTSEGKNLKDCLFEGKTFSIKVRNNSKASSDRISCLILRSDGERVAEVEMFNYVGKSSEVGSGEWLETLMPGSEVFITRVVNHFEVFISMVCTKTYPNIFAAAAEDCEPLESEKYAKGDLVLVKTKNEYIRAKILQSSTENDNINVLNVDTGLELTVSKEAMKKPNLFVHSCPYYTRKVKLMYLSSVATPYTDNKALAMLEHCQEKGAEFVLQFNSNVELGVELLLKTGDQQSLNKQLLPMLFEKGSSSEKEKDNKEVLENVMATPPPSPKGTDEPAKPKKMYTLKNLELIPITCGDNVPVMVLDNSTISRGYISGCDFTNKDFLTQLDSEYMPMLSRHCASLDTTMEYSPRVDEICLAVYDVDKEWYRGVCLNQMKDDMFCVMFIDYGNMCRVHKSKIRPITSELMFPSNANLCFFEGIPDEVPREKCDKFIMATQADPKIYAKVTKLEPGTYLLKIKDMDKYF